MVNIPPKLYRSDYSSEMEYLVALQAEEAQVRLADRRQAEGYTNNYFPSSSYSSTGTAPSLSTKGQIGVGLVTLGIGLGFIWLFNYGMFTFAGQPDNSLFDSTSGIMCNVGVGLSAIVSMATGLALANKEL